MLNNRVNNNHQFGQQNYLCLSLFSSTVEQVNGMLGALLYLYYSVYDRIQILKDHAFLILIREKLVPNLYSTTTNLYTTCLKSEIFAADIEKFYLANLFLLGLQSQRLNKIQVLFVRKLRGSLYNGIVWTQFR